MDLISKYWQVELPPSEQEKCAIITSNRPYLPTCMPQGLCNVPATFQRIMDTILSDLKYSCVLIYLNNITVFSRTFNEHLEHLKQVFIRLAKNNLKLKPKKCHFFKDWIDYLGFIVSKDGLAPQPDKVAAIEYMTSPQSKQDIQVFLGMVGNYRRFIVDFSKTAQPLVHLLKNEVPFIWSSNCKIALDLLRKALISAPVLAYPNFSLPFVIQTDA